MFIPYAIFVLFILFSIYFFSLSSSFEFTNIKLNPSITKSKETKYPGTTSIEPITFLVFPFLNSFIALNTETIIITDNAIYPQNPIVVSVIPAPNIE